MPKFKCEPLAVKVAFQMPDWFPPARLDYSGCENSAIDALLKLKDCSESVLPGTFDGVAIFTFSPGCDLKKKIAATQQKLERFLKRYKEGR
jgi:hypothetical protein